MLAESALSCPYCGEWIQMLIDPGNVDPDDLGFAYYEDCSVCCRPMLCRGSFSPDGELLSLDAVTDSA